MLRNLNISIEQLLYIRIRILRCCVMEGNKSFEERPASAKQISFIESLSKGNEGQEKIVRDYLSSLGKGSVEELSTREASALIDKLKVKQPQGQSYGNSSRMSSENASPKQISYIRSLSAGEKKQDVLSKYLKKVGKDSIENLNKREASELIETLK